MGVLTLIIVLASRRPSKLTQEVLFWIRVDHKKKRVSFEDRSASGSQKICDIFAEFIE
jgi:hypothetical protein